MLAHLVCTAAVWLQRVKQLKHELLQELPCILAAMIPCTRLYAYIGCQLRAAALAAPTIIRAQGPYASWIKEYSSDAFLLLPASKEALLDKLGAAVPYGNDCHHFVLGHCIITLGTFVHLVQYHGQLIKDHVCVPLPVKLLLFVEGISISSHAHTLIGFVIMAGRDNGVPTAEDAHRPQ